MKKKINRREFITKGSTLAVGTGIVIKSGINLEANPSKESRVVEVFHPGSVNNESKVDINSVKAMLKGGMKQLTGSDQPWQKFFKPEDKIGLKINTLGRPRLFTHHELINAVVDELKQFEIKESNIIIWDRWEYQMRDCRFVMNKTDKGVKCYGTEGAVDDMPNRLDPAVFYKSELDSARAREDDGTKSIFSKIFTQECDKIINMAILKNHGLAGVTLCLKNLAFGVCNNNNRFHGRDYISAFISDFCAHPEVMKKTVLHMIDGLEGCYDQGPRPASPGVIFTPKTLWLGVDPVALDAVGRRVIEAKRKEMGVESFQEKGIPVDHIEMAEKKGLGVSDLNRIKIEKINLG